MKSNSRSTSVPTIQTVKGRVVFFRKEREKISTLKPLTVWIFAVAISLPKTGNRIKKSCPAFVCSILTTKPSALLWRRAVGFAVALPHAPDLSQGTEWGVCVNNSKRHLTKRFMGRQNRYCPFYGPETGKQHYPDADRGAYDVRQAEEPGPCQQ